jgi:hypothetical protein
MCIENHMQTSFTDILNIRSLTGLEQKKKLVQIKNTKYKYTRDDY